jgi:hypothetical protein
MEAILKFNLDNPEEQERFNQCMKSKDLADCLSTIYLNLVNIEEDEFKTDKKPSELMDAIMKEYDIDFYKL